MSLSLSSRIEAILFFKSEPVSTAYIARLLDVSEQEVIQGLAELETTLTERGVALVRNGTDVMLQTAPEATELIQKITKEELSHDLGKASLEVLSLVLYRGPISKSDIDYVRGVNSNFILRNLMIRGLIERDESKSGGRGFIYKPSFELLSHLGIKNITELPEYADIAQEIEDIETRKKETTPSPETSHE